MRCHYEASRLKVVSRGGLEFVNNTRLRIDEILPLEDGVIIKAFFNMDEYYFEPAHQSSNQARHASKIGNNASSIKSSTQGERSDEQTYAYMSLLEHPLNDVHPVALESTEISLINTRLEFLHVSQSLPFVVLYDPTTLETRFALLHRAKIEEPIELGGVGITSDDTFIRNLDAVTGEERSTSGDGRSTTTLPTLAGTSQIYLKQIFSTSLNGPGNGRPDKVQIC